MTLCRALICLVSGLLAPVVALSSERIDAAYELTWSGLEIGRFETRLTADGATYRVAYAARTTGFLGWLFPFSSTGSSEGAMADPGPMPARYVVESQRRGETTAWVVDFGPKGEVERLDLTMLLDEERDPVPPALQKAPDPLALALRATRIAAPGARFEEVSFDGKRAVRFALACADAEQAVAPEDDPAVPIRRALDCTVDGELVAGASRRWRGERETERPPARLLLSREIVPGRYWPVRVEAETRFGAVVVRLTGYR
jgi:hypothetical protein